uniref:Uncharacterized protein n=1 Tax=Piliocolobus tephrosceles TaxID=591936 RepID=A0A8C9LN99_9PRIM
MLETGEAVRQQQRQVTLEQPHTATSPSAVPPPRAQEAQNLWRPALKGGEGKPAEGESGSLGCLWRRKDRQESRPPGENFTKFSDYLVIILLLLYLVIRLLF